MNFKKIIHLTGLFQLTDETVYEDEVSRRILFSNVVFISLPAVYAVFMLIDFDAYLIPLHELRFDQFVIPIVILVCFFCLWLNSLGIIILSRVLFLCLWPLLVHLIPIRLQETPSDYYLAYPFGLVFHSMMIQLMFSYKKETGLFWTFLLLNLIGILFSPALLIYFDTDRDLPAGMINNKYYFFDGILYWLLFNLVMFYILRLVESYIKKINDSKALIEEQKEELNALNQNLEQLVAQRTFELEEQNEKLKKHAFYNAHLLRGPFCRVKGLIYLQEIDPSTLYDLQQIKDKLNESIDELDARIREIQQLVETNE